MNIQRSSFYAWKKKLAHPSTRMKSLLSNILLFKEYHAKFPSHGYRWLNAKIRLDTGLVLSDAYAHKCCKITGIKSQAKHYKYKKPGDSYRVFPNLLMTEIQIDGPLQCIVSYMTAFYVKGIYYELTLYMDLCICFRQPAQIHIHVHLRLAGTSLYRRCLFPNEFHKSLTALPHASVIIQAEAGVISIFNLFSVVPTDIHYTKIV